MKIKKILHAAIFLLCVFIFGCVINSPPFYNEQAKMFLGQHGANYDLIDKLTTYKPLSPEEAGELAKCKDVAVLHLVGYNPGTPLPILQQLARHTNFEVRTGVAANKNAPLDLLLQLRTPNKYTTVNATLASNPKIPTNILQEMSRNGEASINNFLRNPNCPVEFMREAAEKKNSFLTLCMVRNPSLPSDLFELFKNDPLPAVRVNLIGNPSVPLDVLEYLQNDQNEEVQRYARKKLAEYKN
ncbi:MAG: hypothetical protein WC637_13475 [Victivallales bacterium]|jgi:hypothetical protein